MTLTVTYSDGSTQTVSSGFTCDKTTLSEGDTAVTVTFEGFTARFSVTVNKVSNLLASGTYGSDITWELTKDGTLTLTGYGDMPDTTEELYKIQQPWFSYRNSIVRVVISQGITGIGDCAFINCGAMTQITIPGSVARIGKNAFSDCSGLPRITLPDSVTAIGEYAFAGCYNLTQINIPHGVTVIERGTFFTCTALEQVEIPASVETVKDSAFLSSGVTQVTVLNKDCQIESDYGTTLGDAGTTVIRGYTGSTAETYAQKYGFTFEAIDGAGGEELIASGTYGENITWTLTKDGTLTLTGKGDMPDASGNWEVPWWRYCKNILSVQIDEAITKIGVFAFNGTGLTQITIPSSVTKIESNAFSDCTSLTQITIPSSVTKIGSLAFNDCASLTQITISNADCVIEDSNFYSTILGNADTTTVRGYTGSTAETYAQKWGYTFEALDAEEEEDDGVWYVVADGTYGENVTWELRNDGTLVLSGSGDMPNAAYQSSATELESQIPWYAHKDTITAIEIAPGITGIGDYAFYASLRLEQVSIPDGVTTIGRYAFGSCNRMTQIAVPDSVTKIGEGAFDGCYNLAQVNIPDGVTAIEKGVFYGCSSLTQIKLPDGVESIGDIAFYGCSSLTQINIPDGVKSIGVWAFEACSNLTEITMPESVVSISDGAFRRCTALAQITVLNKDCAMDDDTNTLGIPGTTTVRGYKGSTAETYAKTYGYTFEALN